MKVLLVSNQRQNAWGVGNPIMYRMRDALEQDERIEMVEFLPFSNSLFSLREIRLSAKEYDVVHIHFGGVYALIIWLALIGVGAKKLITFHGTDIHARALKTAKGWKERLKIWLNQKASFLSIRLFDRCGFVAAEMMDYVPKCLASHMQKKSFVQSLGVNYSAFFPVAKDEAIEYLGLDKGKKYVLFSDVSNTSIKRRDIAEAIVTYLGGNYSLLIMCGVKPQEVREALALSKSVFSVQVGDAAKQLDGLQNSAIISRNPQEAADTIADVMAKIYTDNTRENLQDRLDFVRVNRKVVDKYIAL